MRRDNTDTRFAPVSLKLQKFRNDELRLLLVRVSVFGGASSEEDGKNVKRITSSMFFPRIFIT